MEKQLKRILIIAGIMLCLSGTFFGLITLKARGQVIISEIADLESYVSEYNISVSDEQDIYIYKQDEHTVLLLDTRNYNSALYIHSDVSAKIDKTGILLITIEDRTAISESDISGAYGVIIQCDHEITDIRVQKEE